MCHQQGILYSLHVYFTTDDVKIVPHLKNGGIFFEIMQEYIFPSAVQPNSWEVTTNIVVVIVVNSWTTNECDTFLSTGVK